MVNISEIATLNSVILAFMFPKKILADIFSPQVHLPIPNPCRPYLSSDNSRFDWVNPYAAGD